MNGLTLGLVMLGLLCGLFQDAAGSSVLSVDYRNLISRADLTYQRAVEHSEEGLPVGNGRMGTLVWTTPAELRFQINRVDVYANNSYTNSFNRRHHSPVGMAGCDYCGGGGFVDVDFADYGPAVFPNDRTIQHLSVYDALVTVKGAGVSARILAWHEGDVIAVEVSDTRQVPAAVNINLRMLRPAGVETKNHLAKSELGVQNGRIILTQEFTEGSYYCGSAVVISVLGRESKAKLANETTVRLSAEPAKGTFTILIASAASFDREEDIVSIAARQLSAAAAKGFDGLLESNKQWWRDFWSRAFVHLHSDDGVVDEIERNYNYFLYIMASSSRGSLPAKFNGMLWSTQGDRREWGSQHWWNNLSFLYKGLFAANRLELLDPMFDMYTGMYDSLALAARQQWGSKGIFIPEAVWFDGLAELPDDIAEEMRDLYLLKKPWAQRSSRFCRFADSKHPQTGRWNWKGYGKWVDGHWQYPDKEAGPFGQCVHILSSTARVPFLYWQRYEYTQDIGWLRNRAYPMLKGGAEFYRNFPNVKKGPDGKYHINHVNNNEGSWDCLDPMDEMTAMHGIFPAAIKASEILDVDVDLRRLWQEFLDNLAPLPRSDNPEAGIAADSNQPVYWINTVKSAYLRGRSRVSQRPNLYYDLCTLETKSRDPETFRITSDTFDLSVRNKVTYRMAIAAAMLGRSDEMKQFLPGMLRLLPGGPERKERFYSNRLANWEGPQAMSVEDIGAASDALHLALCQGVPAGPGGETVIHVFAAWPKCWDAAFTLLCRGAFLVTSSMRKGTIEFVEIKSRASSQCRLHNPWSGAKVTVYRDGKKWKSLEGSLLKFETTKGRLFVIVPAGLSPSQYKRVVPAEKIEDL